MKSTIDVSGFKKDHEFYDEIHLLLTIKSFDLKSIRARYLDSRKNAGGKTGSVERRAVGIGGIAKVTIEKGEITKSEVITRLKEPRGITAKDDLLAISSEKTVYLIEKNKKTIQIDNPWFSYIHTVHISKDGSKVLVSSSGFDSVFEYDIKNRNKTYEWFAWENGFNKATDPKTGEPVYLTRNAKTAEEYIESKQRAKLISNPETEVLPTAMRAAFINTAQYDFQEDDKILATFFHEGAVYQIDKNNGTSKAILNGLKNPHGGCNFRDNYMVTSTGSGEVIVGGSQGVKVFDFKNLPGKPAFLEKKEWLQNSIAIDNNIITIDSNRNAFVIYNPGKQLISMVEYDENWAIQDLINGVITPDQEAKLKAIAVK